MTKARGFSALQMRELEDELKDVRRCYSTDWREVPPPLAYACHVAMLAAVCEPNSLEATAWLHEVESSIAYMLELYGDKRPKPIGEHSVGMACRKLLGLQKLLQKTLH